MKTYCYMGENIKNLSRLSCKYWQIEQKGREVSVFWGPAKIEKPGRVGKLVATADPQAKFFELDSASEARDDAQRRIEEKLGKGYKLFPGVTRLLRKPR